MKEGRGEEQEAQDTHVTQCELPLSLVPRKQGAPHTKPHARPTSKPRKPRETLAPCHQNRLAAGQPSSLVRAVSHRTPTSIRYTSARSVAVGEGLFLGKGPTSSSSKAFFVQTTSFHVVKTLDKQDDQNPSGILQFSPSLIH